MNNSKEPPDVTLSKLIYKMRANKTTPYGSSACTYTRYKGVLLTAVMLLRVKGHADMADYMESEIERMDRIPAMDTEIDNYLRALVAQLRLCGEAWDYCKKNADLADVLPHLSFGRRAENRAV